MMALRHWELIGVNVHTEEKRVLYEGYGNLEPQKEYNWKIGDVLWGWFRLDSIREISFEELISPQKSTNKEMIK